ncbi:MAG: hypothetical protein IPK82_26805 [Polyangiaceae bacterium]|nr:hypothetical protein [Polyangiaceae bacterium]
MRAHPEPVGRSTHQRKTSQESGTAGQASALSEKLNSRPQVAAISRLSDSMSGSTHRPLQRVVVSPSGYDAPVQRALWDYVPSWSKVKEWAPSVGVGTVATGLLAATGVGLVPALALGGLSAVASKAAGPGAGIGAAAGGLAGGLAGGAAGGLVGATTLGYGGAALGHALGGSTGKWMGGGIGAGLGAMVGSTGGMILGGLTGALFGGAMGADVQSHTKRALLGNPVVGVQTGVPSVGETVYRRGVEAARRAHGDGYTLPQLINQFDHAGLRAELTNLTPAHGFDQNDAALAYPVWIANFFAGDPGVAVREAQPMDYQNNDRNQDGVLIAALQANPYVASILDGTLFAAAPPLAPSLTFGGAAPPLAVEARDKFNKLVDHPLPQVGQVRTGSVTDPISYMSDTGNLTVGWGSPKNVLVHEMGHHLENNLSPMEFASMHNFLLARSHNNQFRTVGGKLIVNQEHSGEGYNTDTPNPDVQGSQSLTQLGVNMLKWRVGMESGEEGIDRSIQQTAHTPEASYVTKVYEGGAFRTEFLATTIHLLSRRDTADTLVQADPLRVAMFLSVAQPAAYQQVRLAMAAQGQNLDALIHKLG